MRVYNADHEIKSKASNESEFDTDTVFLQHFKANKVTELEIQHKIRMLNFKDS